MVAALLTVVCVSCTHDVQGQPRPMTSLLTALPTDEEISGAVGNTLSTYDFEPFVGGVEIMPDGFRVDADATPIRCAGVTETMLRVTYEKSDVVEAARQSYFNLNTQVEVSGADAAAVRLASPVAAEELFETFTRDWRSCDGQTVVKHLHGTAGPDVEAAISDVVVDDPMLSATVVTEQGGGPNAHYLRAVARRAATIVEVSLALTAEAAAAPPSAAALRVARVMLDKADR